MAIRSSTLLYGKPFMSNSNDVQDPFAGQVRVIQFIVGAITLGPLVYLGVVFSIPPKPEAGGDETLLTYLACGMAVASVIAWLLIPPLVTATFRRKIAAGTWPPPGQAANLHAAPLNDAGKLCAAYTIRTIIAIAILEGAAFFLVTAYQIERNPLALGVAGLLIVMIALHMPTRSRVATWVDGQLQRLNDDRQAEQFLQR